MYISVTEAAEQLGVCKKTILRRIASGDLKAYRLSPRHLRIDEKDLASFIHGMRIQNEHVDEN